MKRNKIGGSFDAGIVNIWEREVGSLSSLNFARRFAASKDLVRRLGVLHKLVKHQGVVNTVSFNDVGDVLVSGAADMKIILWQWEISRAKISFHSRHNCPFQAKIVPNTNNRNIITCGEDGKVRLSTLLDGGKMNNGSFASLKSKARMSIDPESNNNIYICCKNGRVVHIDLRTQTLHELFTCRSLQLREIAIDPRNANFFAIGGSDQFARLYDIRKCREGGSVVDFFCPPQLIHDDSVMISGVAFSKQSELLVSYWQDYIYLFSRNMGLGRDPSSISQVFQDSDASSQNMDANRNIAPPAYKGHINHILNRGVCFFGPSSDYVVSVSDCRRIFIWKKESGELIRVMGAEHDLNCIDSHPHTAVLASSEYNTGIKIWMPKAKKRATLPTDIPKRIPTNIMDGVSGGRRGLYERLQEIRDLQNQRHEEYLDSDSDSDS